MTNPFTIGKPVPPERFVGRRRLIRSAFHQIKNRGSLAVWGGIGMGKTSFLKYLSYPQIWQENKCDPSQAVIALVDCSLIYPLNSNLFWQDVLKKVNKKLNSGSRLQVEVEKLLQKDKNTQQDLLTVLDLLARENKFIEQTLLMLLALSNLKGRIGNQSYDLGGIERIFSRNTEDLKNLVELGVLSKTSEEEEEGTGYVFTSSMMEWWVVEKIKKSDIEEISKREKVFRQLISTEQKDKAIVAIDWITKHQNQIPTILKWVGNLLP